MGRLIKRTALTGYRVTGGGYDDTDGQYKNQVYTEFDFRASVQPLKGNEMEMLPKGRRDSQSYNLYNSSVKLNTVKTQNPDIVIIDNEQHEIFNRGNWQNNIINHYHYIAVKLDKEKEVTV